MSVSFTRRTYMIHRYRLSICLLFCTHLYSGEVDHYLSWGNPLTDSTNPLNTKMNEMVIIALESLPNDCSCEFAASTILSEFGVKFNSDLERWIKESTDLDLYRPDWSEAVKKSIFRIPSKTERMEELEKTSLSIQIDEIINIGGIYFGIDKLSHFTGSGYLYYQTYLIFMDNPDINAEEMAIWFGILGEKSIIGRIASGVFSYADLEANYQGMQLGRNMCEGDNPMLLHTVDGWALTHPIDMRNYVNPLWDESYNPSYYYDGFNLTLMPKNTPVLNNMPDYCESFQSPFVQDLFSFYDSFQIDSPSNTFLQHLIQEGKLPSPAPFDIRTICND